MKRIAVCTVIAILIIAGGIASVLYTSDFSGKMSENITRIENKFEEGDIHGAKQAMYRTEKQWDGFRRFHILISDDDHALEITMSLAKMQSLLEQGDDELLTECETAKQLIERYGYEQLPYIMNIL